jgi:hypothetical protein
MDAAPEWATHGAPLLLCSKDATSGLQVVKRDIVLVCYGGVIICVWPVCVWPEPAVVCRGLGRLHKVFLWQMLKMLRSNGSG